MADEPETHTARCKREEREQEEILAKVADDSKRYDEEVEKRRAAPNLKSTPPVKAGKDS
jgi:hypothetical protein